MKARGRHFLGYPRALIGVLVALIATSAALFLFFQAKTQTYSSPLDTLSSQLDAGKDAPDIVEQAESADPAPPSITISTMLDRTAPIENYLRDAGMEPSDAHQWASYIERIIANRYFQSGHPLTLYKDPETGAMRGIKYDVDQNTTMTAASLGAGVLKAGLRPIEYYIRPIKMTFEVKDNFQHAAAEQGIPKPIVDSLQDAFSDRHDLNRLAPGSAVKLIYQEKVSRDGSYTLVGDVQAAQIRFGSRTLTAISFADEQGRPHLYDEQGHALGPQSLRFPLSFQYISSGFTFHRWHPILHEYRPHVGVDLVAKYGEPVKAVADGKVISAGRFPGRRSGAHRGRHDALARRLRHRRPPARRHARPAARQGGEPLPPLPGLQAAGAARHRRALPVACDRYPGAQFLRRAGDRRRGRRGLPAGERQPGPERWPAG